KEEAMTRLFARVPPCVALLMALGASAAVAQDRPASHDSIIAVVQQFFTAMEARDTATIARLFLPDSRATLIEHHEGVSRIGGSTTEQFLAELPQARARLRERMWSPRVLEHNGLAVLWAPYDFRLDDRFSHCGVDAFTLLRDGGGWRVAGVAYTVEVTGCPEDP